LKKYKDSKEAKKSRPISLEKITELANESPPDWDSLISNVISLAPGKDNADKYEKAIEALLTALFYPALTNPISQHRIHDDRKRIDITFTNMATGGFFSWLAAHYTSSQIMVECKNYTRDLKNPELDQLSSRFSRSRGRVGLIICRGFDKKELFEERCRDTAKDDRGFVIVLDDDDLADLVTWRRDNQLYEPFPLLRTKFQKLID
jgi:hypothetical protein